MGCGGPQEAGGAKLPTSSKGCGAGILCLRLHIIKKSVEKNNKFYSKWQIYHFSVTVTLTLKGK